MKTLIIVLVIASFLQATILKLDLVLIILICRSFIKTDKVNLLLAFAFGLFISHLSLTVWGFQSLIYLILIQATQMLNKSQLNSRPLFIVPIVFLATLINIIADSYITPQTPQFFPQAVFETVLALPIFYLLRLWEERFIVKKEIRLKI